MESILEIASAFQRSRVLLSAFELDIFTVLADERRSSEEVAGAIGAEARATDRVMNALCAMGLLEKRDGLFANTDQSGRYLVKGKPDYMAGLGHTAHMWETWSTLTATVRDGKPAPGTGVLDRGEDWLRPFIAAMHWRGRRHAPAVVSLLDLRGVSRVLDVGGGSGAFAMAFVRARAGISAVVFDLPGVLPLTRNYAHVEGFAALIETVAGDYLTDDLPAGFDLVFLSAVVHSNSAGENERLIRKSAAALNPGGQVVIQDWLMAEDRSGPAGAALFAINMLVGTKCGDTYTESEVRGWMAAAGLGDIHRTDVPSGTSLMIGRKR